MADTELHETDSEDQKDWQAETDADVKDTDTNETDANETDEADDDYGVSMDKVQAVLNATADKSEMTPQMQRMMSRQAENTRRVEETIKGTKSNPRWFVPLFCALMIIGLIWTVATRCLTVALPASTITPPVPSTPIRPMRFASR